MQPQAVQASSNATGLVFDARMLSHCHLHDSEHPERPARVVKIMEQLEFYGLAQKCVRIPAVEVDPTLLRTLHSDAYCDLMQQTSSE